MGITKVLRDSLGAEEYQKIIWEQCCVFRERAAKAGIPRNLKQSGDKVQLLSHT